MEETKPTSKARGTRVAAREATQHAAMAKLADALRLGRSGRKPMVVQVHLAAHGSTPPYSVPFLRKGYRTTTDKTIPKYIVSSKVEQPSYTRRVVGAVPTRCTLKTHTC